MAGRGQKPYIADATSILLMLEEQLPAMLARLERRRKRAGGSGAVQSGITSPSPGEPGTEIDTGFPSFVTFTITASGSAAQDLENYANLASAWFLLDLTRDQEHVFYTGSIVQQNWAISQVDTGLITIAGVDLTAKFPSGQAFWISGSTGNDGLLTSTGAALNGSDTEISVSGPADLADDGRVFLLDLSAEVTECGPFGSNPTLDRTSLTVSVGIDSSGNIELRCAADGSGGNATGKVAWLAFQE